MNEPIELIVRKSETANGTAPDKGKVNDKEQGKPSLTQKAVNGALINAGKNIILSGISKSGDLTGNYHSLQKFNYAMSAGSDILMIAKLGPVGVIGVVGKHAVAIGNSFVSQIQADRDYELKLQRSGNLALNGSRFDMNGR